MSTGFQYVTGQLSREVRDDIKKSEMDGANSLTLHETVDHIGVVTMNNGKKLNALGSEPVQGILDSLDRFETSEIRAVILRALPGTKVWSAGHNIKEIS